MDQRITERLMAALAAQVSDDELAAVVAEARAAALAELRARLTDLTLQGLLDRLAAPPAPAQAPAPKPPVVPPPASLAPTISGETAIYLYAVRRAGGPPPAGRGVASGDPIYALPCGDLEAIVSRVPLAELGEAALEANLRDPVWLERVVRAHQDALDGLLPHGPIVPLRLATICSGELKVAELVAERAGALRASLAWLAGRAELGVKLFVHEAALAERVAEASPAVRTLRDEIGAKPAGAAYMLRRKLDKLAAAEVLRLSDACAAACHACLAELAVAQVRSPLRDRAPGSAELMLLNAAYLVDDERRAAFVGELERLRAEYGPLGFRFELSGPWPAYNFLDPAPREDVHGTLAVS
jgi:hypothetical protein